MLIFKHNLLIDLRAIKRTILIKKWLDKNGYIYYLSTTDVKYKKINYLKLTDQIITELKKYPFLKEVKNKYIIYLSKFGVLGSYAMPNKIFINIQREIEDIIKTLIHEMVHLQVEDYVKNNNLDQKEKEKLVDDTINKNF